MLQNKDLNILIKQHGLIGIESLSYMDTKKSIEVKSIEEVVHIAKSCNINVVFYHYTYPSPEMMTISEDVILSSRIMDNASTKVLMARINKYNEQVKQIDQQKPIALLLFILYNGYLIFFYESDEWFIDKGFDFPELKLLEFANEAEAEIAKEREKDTIVFDKTKEEIRKKLLYDKEFHGCTNSYMRTQYVERHYDLEMRRMFREHGDHLVSFVESIWKEYKSNRLLYCKPQNE